MKSRTKLFTRTLLILLVTYLTTQSLLPLVPNIIADSSVDQSIEVCFIATDYEQKILNSLPGNTSINLKLYTDPGHLIEGKVNDYGNDAVLISWASENSTNKKLAVDNGHEIVQIDAYCTTNNFRNASNHEYTYTPASIISDLDWLPATYNDEISIDFVDPDIAFPYSGEWFDDVVGNEAGRNKNADGHINMSQEKLNRRLMVVTRMDQNLPDYGVVFSDGIPSNLEYTLSTIPSKLEPGSTINVRFAVQNAGKLTWFSGETPTVANPVNVSYHWKNIVTGEYYQYEGNRALLNQDVAYTFSDSNVALTLNTPTTPGKYQLILDLVHEGVTWFSQTGADTKTFNIQVGEPVQSRVLQSFVSEQLVSAQAATGSYYTVQPFQGGNWHCLGSDCLSGIAEDYYHCNANGIPNDTAGDLTTKCWWPIYAANQNLFANVPPSFASHPWDYVQVGWVLYIPPFDGGVVIPPPPPVPTGSNFNGLPGSSQVDPYAGMNGSTSPWPQITFDRFIAWDGSQKFDQIKQSETSRLTAPTVTGIATNDVGTAVTIYGVAIPKYHPIHVRVWNEYRYCWACGSGWDFHYQQGSAQHVKVVLFKEGWQYLGEVWNDRADGRWNITLPLGTNLKSGDRVFAEVQIEADYTFNNLRWWSDTYESVNFNIRNPKYFGYPYWGSGGSNMLIIPSILVDPRSDAERAIDFMGEKMLGGSGASPLTNICGIPAKTYSNLRILGNQPGAVLYVNNRPIFSYGGTWDTFNYYSDRCERFGAPINSPYNGGVGPYNTSGAYQDFAKGRIYWSWKYLGKFLYGSIWNKFEVAGGTNSHYGWPKDEVHPVTRNGRTLNCQNFEGGEICDGEFTPYTDAQKAFSNLLGREVLVSEISVICGDKEKINIDGGIAYYDKRDGKAKRITGDIYTAWNENCNYGFPENETSRVTGFNGSTGYAQRFNSNEPWVFDFYQKDGSGVVILEGTPRNIYESLGGVHTTGFPKRYYTDPYRIQGFCVETETTTKCEQERSAWADALINYLQPRGQIFDKDKVGDICAGVDYKSHPLVNPNGVVYYDPNDGSTRAITDSIHAHWLNTGNCDKYGLPENDTTTVTAPTNTIGRVQRFNLDKDNVRYITDFYDSGFGLHTLEGTVRNLYEGAGGLWEQGFPKKVETTTNRGVCVTTEKRLLCEREAPEEPSDPKCPEGMVKYTNPNDVNDKVCAKINSAPYINQYLSQEGVEGNPTHGKLTCGSNAVIMIAAANKKLTDTTYQGLKDRVDKDMDINHTEVLSCNQYGGVFGRTVISCGSLWHEWWRMSNVLENTFKLETHEYKDRIGKSKSDFIADIKLAVDSGGYVLQGVGGHEFSHIFTILGYTEDDRAIVNDSWRNIMNTSAFGYETTGKGAIYGYNEDGWVFRSSYLIY